jgi:NTP pyrophosphatase (non-canonical NTP hydrolase)
MNFQDLQKFINKYNQKLETKFGKVEDKEKLILSSTVKLTEELGELCDEVMTFNGRQRKEKLAEREGDNLSAEFADVILAVFMLAKNMNVNINEALEKKIEKIRTKYGFF